MEETNPPSSIVGCMLFCYKAASDPLACLTIILSSIFLTMIVQFRLVRTIFLNALKWFINASVHVAPTDSSLSTAESCSDGNVKNDDSSTLIRGDDIDVVMEILGMGNGKTTENIGLHKEILGLFEEEEPRMEEVKEAFDVFDENGDGFIDANELKKIIGKLGFEKASEVDCQMMIKTFDCDGDGRISVGEFVRLLEFSFSN